MQYTTKLKLKKPDLTDYVNINDLNENMDLIDTEISKMTDEETGVEAKLNHHAADKNNPHGVTKKQVGLESVQNYGVATQAEAEAGISAAKYMTPERTSQAIDKKLTPLNETVTQHLDDYTTFKSSAEKLIKIKKNTIISTANWLDDTTTSGFWIRDLNDTDIDSNTVVDVNIHLSSLENASSLKSVTESFDGYVRLYADEQPITDITVDLKLIRELGAV